MLLFRSEEHARNWSTRWNQPEGSLLSTEQAWGLAIAWYSEDRREPGWRRKTLGEAQEIFAGLGLILGFWKL